MRQTFNYPIDRIKCQYKDPQILQYMIKNVKLHFFALETILTLLLPSSETVNSHCHISYILLE